MLGRSASKRSISKTTPKDSVDNTFAGTVGANAVEAGQGGDNPYNLVGYYNTVVVTPEAQGGDYIQFSIGQHHGRQKMGLECLDVRWARGTRDLRRLPEI